MEIAVAHISILVKDINQAKKFYRDILGLEVVEENDVNRGTPGAYHVATYRIGNFEIEMMAPTGPDSTILNRTIEKHGEGLHHYCFTVSDMDTVIKRCQAAGIRLLDSFGNEVKLGGNNAYTDPRATHKTLIQFLPK